MYLVDDPFLLPSTKTKLPDLKLTEEQTEATTEDAVSHMNHPTIQCRSTHRPLKQWRGILATPAARSSGE
jgi:hypothetical protein